MTISPPSFAFVSDLARRETAMLYDPGKEYLVEARLLPLAREAGCADVDGYVARLRTDPVEQAKALDALTINETSWFRDNAPYQAFTEVMLPAMVAARSHVRHLSIWSAACSSGQEAYSLAMLLDQHLPAGWTAQILATDVSTTMLARVDAGRYSQVEMNRGLPATSLVKYFSRAGSEWEISEDLKRMVRTQQLNLSAPFPLLPTFDIVFLRNVLIYFDLETKRDILRRMRQVVAPDGFLLLGSSETTLDLEDDWNREAHGRTQLHRPATTTLQPIALTGA
ncbi:protein-glutamate O-methyltransferase CheR [Nocardioides marmoriginsengisoli]|uniref:protein-glutamate O-methyltransferase n=1 Tax=Nocardioides marmoriginsengisoli TaxID=661483 RepID=A0A3N0CGV4_9ACTN|nr:protein-glutamate O-methyltransferase CheR [Nocardioides marmoriginsengisoli]RNL62667.1 protein-glutamate O-methyltransferase CheR [Nocardioides marmoriginsengisoli]